MFATPNNYNALYTCMPWMANVLCVFFFVAMHSAIGYDHSFIILPSNNIEKTHVNKDKRLKFNK